MAKIAFISHASEDAAIAARITDYLENNDVACWLAPRDVTPGRDYSSEIVEGIESSAVFVLVLSENANQSIYVKREVERAVSKGKPIFPIRVREVMPSKSLELFISSAHWIDAWTPPLEKYLERLAQSISSAAAVYPAAAPVSLEAKASVPSLLKKQRRFLAAALAAIALLMLAGGGWYGYRLTGAGRPLQSNADPQVQEGPEGSEVPMGRTPPQVAVAPATLPSSLSGPVESCPSSLNINRDLPTPFTCTCSGQAARDSSAAVWGTDVYTANSNLCRAAVHAGAIGTDGGELTVERSEGRLFYVASSRNGVTSYESGGSSASIMFK